MAEGKESGSEAATRTPEKRAQEVGVVARKMVTEKAAEVARTVKPVDQLTDTEKAFRLVHRLQTEEDPKFGIGDDSIKLKEFSVGDFSFGRNEASIAKLNGATEDGFLKAHVRGKDGEIVMKADGSGPQEFQFSRDEVVDAQIFSEQSRLLPEFDGDDKSLLRTHVDALPQNPSPAKPGSEADAVIEQAAEKFGIAKIEEVHTFVDNLTPEQMGDADLHAAVQALKGRKIVTQAEFADIIAKSGETVDSLTGKVDSLQTKLGDLDDEETKVKALADDDPTKQAQLDSIKQQREDAQKQKGAFEKAHKVAKDEADAEEARVAAELKAEEAAAEKRNTPEADAAITTQIKFLQDEIANAGKEEPATDQEKRARDERVRQLKSQLGTLQLASLTKGEPGAFVKRNALRTVAAEAGKIGHTARQQQLEGVADRLGPQAEAGKAILDGVLDKAAEDAPAEEAEKIKAMKTALEGSEGDLAKLLASGDFTKVKGFAESLFGAELTGDEAIAVDKLKNEALMNLADGAGLTEEQKSELKKKIWKGIGWAALIAALASVALMAAPMAMAGSSLANERR